MAAESGLIAYFKSQGLVNPYRVRQLIGEAIHSQRLDLKGLTVWTEAASRNYVVTPIIAALAGADVYAVACDSRYGKAKDIERLTVRFAAFCKVNRKIKVVFKKDKMLVRNADIITNLGFVRPIDEELILQMSDRAVIPYMSEAWELRGTDIDLKACRRRNIPVAGTNEHGPGSAIFDFVGPLCIKMLLELQIEVYQSRIIILSPDKFGEVIRKYLKSMGAQAVVVKNLSGRQSKELLIDADALVVADYKNMNMIIGKNGQIQAKELAKLSRKISVVQLAGKVSIDDLKRNDIPCHPLKKMEANRMAMTLADLGPRPVIDLHTAGLKVGEILAKAKSKGLQEIRRAASKSALVQLF